MNSNNGTPSNADGNINPADAAGAVANSIGGATDQLSDAARQTADTANSKLKEAATAGKEKAADGVHALADAARSTASRFDAQGRVADYANWTADELDHLSDRLRGSSLDDLAADAKAFVKENPILTAGAAALVGFAVVRCLKSSLSHTDGD